jgi:hypothetical protein
MQDIAVDDRGALHIADIGAGTTDPANVRLFRGPSGEMRVEIQGERCLLRGKAVWVFPLTLKRYVSILDTKEKEFCLIEDPEQLDEESQRILFATLDEYYRVYRIRAVCDYRNDWRTSFWTVETDHGLREFVMRWELDSVLLPSENEILIIDIDGNRFHIPDIRELDENSQRIFELLL